MGIEWRNYLKKYTWQCEKEDEGGKDRQHLEEEVLMLDVHFHTEKLRDP